VVVSFVRAAIIDIHTCDHYISQGLCDPKNLKKVDPNQKKVEEIARSASITLRIRSLSSQIAATARLPSKWVLSVVNYKLQLLLYYRRRDIGSERQRAACPSVGLSLTLFTRAPPPSYLPQRRIFDVRSSCTCNVRNVTRRPRTTRWSACTYTCVYVRVWPTHAALKNNRPDAMHRHVLRTSIDWCQSYDCHTLSFLHTTSIKKNKIWVSAQA